MARFLILFNHVLTGDQELDAVDLLGIDSFCYPPTEISVLWKSVPPEAPELRPILSPVFQWIDETASAGDYLLVQGDFGATWMIVDHAMKKGLVPVYSTTERVAQEVKLPDETVKTLHWFRHVIFREYGR